MSQNDSSRRNIETTQGSSGAFNLERKKILVLIKAAPIPSQKYRETVCTAGIDENGNWYRIYPIPFRYLNSKDQFRKYQWIEVDLTPVDPKHDTRKESRKPIDQSIKILTEPIPTKKGWSERKSIILPLVSDSVEALQQKFYDDGTSLGIVKPREVKFLAKSTESTWTGTKAKAQNQLQLFGPQIKTLDKVPYDFYYEFKCQNPECRGHKMTIQDWELFALYYHLKTQYHYAQDVILEKIKQKYLDEMCRSDKDTYFFLGTVHNRYKRPNFTVLGVFWPPKTAF